MPQEKTLLVGCGEMGSALLKGWLTRFSPARFLVISPHVTKEKKRFPDIQFYTHPDHLPDSDVITQIVFAVKPQILREIMPQYAQFSRTTPLCLSIAAGISLKVLETCLPSPFIIRAMPNLAAGIGQSVTFLKSSHTCTPSHQKVAVDLFDAIGTTYWLEKEDLFNLATAFTGCGPGFIYRFMEGFLETVLAQGFPPENAQHIAKQLLLGSALYAKASPHTFSELSQQVAVKGGMTAAGINALNDNNRLNTLLKNMVQSAIKQGIKLDT